MKSNKKLPLVITLATIALPSCAFAANWSNTALHINNGFQKNRLPKRNQIQPFILLSMLLVMNLVITFSLLITVMI